MLILLAALAASPLPPKSCDGHMDYAGRPLHSTVAAAIPAGSVVEAPLSNAMITALDDAFKKAKGYAKAPSITASVATLGQGLWQRTDADGAAPLLFWASVGKTFTAVVVLQLVEEGKLRLDDTVDHWEPGVPNAKAITVRDLLAHISGLYSANEDATQRGSMRPMTDEQELAILRRHGAYFCPGQDWRYSNSGYWLLGRIIAQVDGRPWRSAIEERIIKPLHLDSVRVLRPGATDGVAPLVSSKPETLLDIATPGAAGPVAARAADMVRFWAAILEGRIVKPATRDAMFATLYPMFDPGTWYGLGTMLFDVPDGNRQLVLLGHAGGAAGSSAIVAYAPANHAIVAVAMTGDGPAAAVANLLLRTAASP